MKRRNIEKHNLTLKNILSAPAPLGRILNYIYLSGSNELYHKNGYRKLGLKDNIGSAWTTEFMIGLDIFKKEIVDNSTRSRLILTHKGNQIYNELIKRDLQGDFDEGTSDNIIHDLKELIGADSDLYSTLMNMFVTSLPYKILIDYLESTTYDQEFSKSFKRDFFETVQDTYDDNSSKSYKKDNRTTSLSTGDNRTVALMQLCHFFGFIENIRFKESIMKEKYDFYNDMYNTLNNRDDGVFDVIKVKDKDNYSSPFLSTDRASNQHDNSLGNVEDLTIDEIESIYGKDGTVTVNQTVRNSDIQRKFRQKLVAEFSGKCVICSINQTQLLIASHIKTSASSNSAQKIDVNNGLLLCPNHDKLFDNYLITFDSNTGKIVISNKIPFDQYSVLSLDPNFHLKKECLTLERRLYLSEHNNIFRSHHNTNY